MALPRRSAAALSGLGLLDALQTLLLLGQGRGQAGMGLVLGPAVSGEFLLGGDEKGLAEALDAELADERQARGGEEHLLAHGGRVGDVGDGDVGVGVAGGGIVELQEDVGGGGRGQQRVQGGEVGGEGGAAAGGDGVCWDERFLVDGCYQAALGWV